VVAAKRDSTDFSDGIMRVTTDLFVSALMRRVFSAGGFSAILQRGATEAGAVFIIVRGRMGDTTLYAPAPQTSYDEATPDDRRFTLLLAGTSDEIDARLERERRFDPDIWVVEIEPANQAIEDLIAVTTP